MTKLFQQLLSIYHDNSDVVTTLSWKQYNSKEAITDTGLKYFADFRAFEQAGRKLADLHINYENKELYPVNFTKNISQLKQILKVK